MPETGSATSPAISAGKLVKFLQPNCIFSLGIHQVDALPAPSFNFKGSAT